MATQPDRDSTLIWRRSTTSGGGGECIEVATTRASVLVRDSRNRSGAVLAFTSAQWIALLRRIRSGEGIPRRPH